jgi:hypothetical protein
VPDPIAAAAASRASLLRPRACIYLCGDSSRLDALGPRTSPAQDEEDYEVEDLKIDSDDELDDSRSASPVRSQQQGSKQAIAAAMSQQDLRDSELLVPSPSRRDGG